MVIQSLDALKRMFLEAILSASAFGHGRLFIMWRTPVYAGLRDQNPARAGLRSLCHRSRARRITRMPRAIMALRSAGACLARRSLGAGAWRACLLVASKPPSRRHSPIRARHGRSAARHGWSTTMTELVMAHERHRAAAGTRRSLAIPASRRVFPASACLLPGANVGALSVAFYSLRQAWLA